MRDDMKGRHRDVPTLLFIHGSGGGTESFEYGGWTTLRNSLIDAGWAVVEGLGGGVSTSGNLAAQTAYAEMVAWLETQISIGTLVILGQSLGGLVAYNLATRGPLADRHDAVIIQNGTTDLTYRYLNDGYWVGVAWGIDGPTDPEAFQAVAGDYDPMQFPLDVWNDKRVRQIWGAQDTSVRPEHHGAAWVLKYGAHVGDLTVHINDPGGHDPMVKDQMATFAYMEGLRPAPAPPLPTRIYRVDSVSRIG